MQIPNEVKSLYDEDLLNKEKALREAIYKYSTFVNVEFDPEGYERLKAKAKEFKAVQDFFNGVLRAFFEQIHKDFIDVHESKDKKDFFWTFNGMSFSKKLFDSIFDIAYNRYKFIVVKSNEPDIQLIENEFEYEVKKIEAKKAELEKIIEERFDAYTSTRVFYSLYIENDTVLREEG